MTLKIENIGEFELLSFVDGQMSKEDAAVVETYLDQNPEKGAEVAAWQEQTRLIQTLHGQVAQEPIPDRLKPANLMRQRRAANSNVLRNIAASLAFIAIGLTAGWFARDLATPNPLLPKNVLTAAVDAHELFTAQKKHVVEVASDGTGNLMTWLSKSLDRSFVLPNDLPNGFQLVGGRLLSANGTPAAQLIYDNNGKRISLYITPRTSDAQAGKIFEDKKSVAKGQQVAALYWANSSITCTIVGDLSRSEMDDIAQKVYQKLNWSSKEKQTS